MHSDQNTLNQFNHHFEKINEALGKTFSSRIPLMNNIGNHSLLGEGKRLSVTEIHNLLNIEQSTTSHHLGILKDKGILASSRQGKSTLYYLKNENLSKLVRCISECACD